MGGGWEMNTGAHQTPNMDMRTHIKRHQEHTSKDVRKTQSYKQTFLGLIYK